MNSWQKSQVFIFLYMLICFFGGPNCILCMLLFIFVSRTKKNIQLSTAKLWTKWSIGPTFHWGWVTHECVDNLIIMGSDNGLLPGQCQALIWTNAGILIIGPLGTNFCEILIKIHTSPFKKMYLKMWSAECQPSCLSLNVSKIPCTSPSHYIDVIMTTMASQITSLAVVYSSVYLDADQRKHQSSASLAFVWGIHRDRWIPRTKGQLRKKCFHLMTSSC